MCSCCHVTKPETTDDPAVPTVNKDKKPNLLFVIRCLYLCFAVVSFTNYITYSDEDKDRVLPLRQLVSNEFDGVEINLVGNSATFEIAANEVYSSAAIICVFSIHSLV